MQALADQMTAASVTASGTQITFAGANFPVAADRCEAIVRGQVSDSCSIDSAGSVVATFTDGVPTGAAATSPQLRFVTEAASHYAVVAEDATIDNPLVITAASAALESSFAGGQTLEITATGLTSDVKLGNSEIRVCGKPCAIAAGSSAATFACSTPAISTKKSIESFKIQEKKALRGEVFFNSGTMTETDANNVFDGQILPPIGWAE